MEPVRGVAIKFWSVNKLQGDFVVFFIFNENGYRYRFCGGSKKRAKDTLRDWERPIMMGRKGV